MRENVVALIKAFYANTVNKSTERVTFEIDVLSVRQK